MGEDKISPINLSWPQIRVNRLFLCLPFFFLSTGELTIQAGLIHRTLDWRRVWSENEGLTGSSRVCFCWTPMIESIFWGTYDTHLDHNNASFLFSALRLAAFPEYDPGWNNPYPWIPPPHLQNTHTCWSIMGHMWTFPGRNWCRKGHKHRCFKQLQREGEWDNKDRQHCPRVAILNIAHSLITSFLNT